MTNRLSEIVAGLSLLFLAATSALAANRHTVRGQVPDIVAKLTPTGRLPANERLNLAIGLPLRNRESLTNLLQQLYDPASPEFHHYLSPEQFSEKFGPTEADYQTVLQFVQTNGLTVVATYSHRQLVDVSANVSEIERAFHVNMRTYQHPTEHRQFYAPDVDPSVDANVPILNISGLNNYSLPHPASHRKLTKRASGGGFGTGPGGELWGKDFRNAYAPGVTLNGAGQYVGLVEFDGYYPNDITIYENRAGLPHVSLADVLLSGSSGYPDNNTNYVAECSLDIEMVICMAPGLSTLYVFEGANFDSVLGSMVTYTQIKQFSASWVGFSFDSTGDNFLMTMGAQGQTFFQASGDGDAYTQSITGPCDDPNVVSCGGTTLTMDATGTNYGSETVWNSGFQVPGWGINGDYTEGNKNGGFWGSGGGVSSTYNIPNWQQGANATAVGGSSTQRNIPDVAMNAQNVWIVFFNGLQQGGWEGTSLAAPLWAGFNSLVNQQAANNGQPPVGFIDPALYIIGEGSSYSSSFHDIIVGNDFWPDSPSAFNSAPGYDLCTGWGTPSGQGTINALAEYAGQIWVNFSAACPGTGAYTSPFCTLASGTGAVSTGGTVCLVGANSTTATPTITKAMTLRAFFGPVTIGP